jgi:hypothetical protein
MVTRRPIAVDLVGRKAAVGVRLGLGLALVLLLQEKRWIVRQYL